MIDVYQATTQMTDESGQIVPVHLDTLLDRALGPEGYYGAFTANMHTDHGEHPAGSDAIVASALARGVPVVSARQMLHVARRPQRLVVRQHHLVGQRRSTSRSRSVPAPTGLTGMVPAASVAGALSGLTRNGAPVTYSLETIKGVAYAVFESPAGNYQAVYGGGAATPTLSISNVSVAEGNSGTTNAVFTVTLSAASTRR